MAQSVFLIGATGHVGKALMAELAPDHAAGSLRVTVGARSPAARERVAQAGLAAADFDLDDWQGFDAALADIDTVFLLRPYTLKQMMMGKQVIDAARRVRVRAIVTLGAYGRPDTPWPIIGWNFLVEAYAERSGLAWTHLRPNYFMDNVLQQRDPQTGVIYNRIERPVSWIASEDIAAVAAAVLRAPQAHVGQAYNLAAEAASVTEIAALLTNLTGRPHSVGRTPMEVMMDRLLKQGREPEYARALVDYVDAVNEGGAPEIADTFDTVERVTGRPATSWEGFLRRRVDEL
ncbi:MAG TPA: NAD(P)H-binding protein [Stellaceae bacterium]|nr:NAD(P)H-binding protein [Stellaceae bacterium]